MARQRCGGAWRLTAGERKRGSTIIGLSAAKRPKPKVKTVVVTVARGSYTIMAGKSATLPMTLNQTGKRLLARFWRVPTTLTFTGTLTHTRTVTFTYSKIDSPVTYQFYTSSGYTTVGP